MSFQNVLRWTSTIFTSIAITSTLYLYLYPIVFGCAFPSTDGSVRDGFRNTVAQHRNRIQKHDPRIPPFRLLVLADPQLEGDSSLPDPEEALLARIQTHIENISSANLSNLTNTVFNATTEFLLEDIPRSLWAVRKTLDLFGNDYYLAHIYRTLNHWTIPTHVTVLGDLIGSQWVSDDEFELRAWRFWNRVFAGGRKVDDEAMQMHQQEKEDQRVVELDENKWSTQIINIAGNHDIGYAGDISRERLDRFESAFGRLNWDLKFAYRAEDIPTSYRDAGGEIPMIQLVVLNSMLLDTPCLESSLQGETFDYINGLIANRLDPVERRNATFTLLLTHVPLHKPEGVCVDGPFFDYWDFEDANGAFKDGGLREQNHLSEFASHQGILQAIYGMTGDVGAAVGGQGRKGIILNGHDHAGCDSVHYIKRTSEIVTKIAESIETDVEADESEKQPTASQQFETSWNWQSVRQPDFQGQTDQLRKDNSSELVTSLREITLRSMMGEYSGNAGLLSLWYNFDTQTWDYAITMCPLGVQHIWWAVHVIDVIAVILLATVPAAKYLAMPRVATAIHAQSTPDSPEATRSGRPIARNLTQSHLKVDSVSQSRSPSQRRRKG